MVKPLQITIADYVAEQIEKRMREKNKSNKSEYVEELIRIGLQREA